MPINLQVSVSLYPSVSLETDFALTESNSVVYHHAVLLQSHLLDLQVTRLLSEEIHLINVMLLIFSKVLLQVVNVFQDLFKNVVEAFSRLMFQGSTFRP